LKLLVGQDPDHTGATQVPNIVPSAITIRLFNVFSFKRFVAKIII